MALFFFFFKNKKYPVGFDGNLSLLAIRFHVFVLFPGDLSKWRKLCATDGKVRKYPGVALLRYQDS